MQRTIQESFIAMKQKSSKEVMVPESSDSDEDFEKDIQSDDDKEYIKDSEDSGDDGSDFVDEEVEDDDDDDDFESDVESPVKGKKKQQDDEKFVKGPSKMKGKVPAKFARKTVGPSPSSYQSPWLSKTTPSNGTSNGTTNGTANGTTNRHVVLLPKRTQDTSPDKSKAQQRMKNVILEQLEQWKYKGSPTKEKENGNSNHVQQTKKKEEEVMVVKDTNGLNAKRKLEEDVKPQRKRLKKLLSQSSSESDPLNYQNVTSIDLLIESDSDTNDLSDEEMKKKRNIVQQQRLQKEKTASVRQQVLSWEVNEMNESEIKTMSTDALKQEVRGTGTGLRWSDKTISLMRRELLLRISPTENKQRQKFEREVRRENRESLDEELEILDEDDDEENNSPPNGSAKSQEENIDDIILQCKEYSNRICKLLRDDSSDAIIKEQPSLLARKLKDYQVVGLNWLYILYKEKINGILADEMGLGKTIQTISLFAFLYQKGEKGPHLVVVPASTLTNWQREFQSWCPKLNICTYYGSQDEREGIKRNITKAMKSPTSSYNVILTTYSIAFQKLDRKFLRKIPCTYLVLDEAQNIKNSQSARSNALKKMNSKHRLLVTGSPLQNNLSELWSLLNFIMPHLFGASSKTWFRSLTNSQVRKQEQYVEQMKSILANFVLRRLKSEVCLQLSPKVQTIEACGMTPMQKSLYDEVLQQSKKAWEQGILDLTNEKDAELILDDDIVEVPKKNNKKQQKSLQNLLNNTLMQMRKLSNHPLLCRSVYTSDKIKQMANALKRWDDEYEGQPLQHIIEDLGINSDFELHKVCTTNPVLKRFALNDNELFETAGKFLRLKSMLPKLIDEGHRILIFSQMTKMLDILEPFLDHLNMKFLRLDGSTDVNERQDLIDQFNENGEQIPIFLLSTRAGGLGINLTSADVVIFYDISFNPTVDQQAEDRVHRLGQEKDVHVYKLITEESVEEQILEMATEKRELNDVMLEEGSFSTSATRTSSKHIRKMFEDIFKKEKRLK